jgi:hypothetical protein
MSAKLPWSAQQREWLQALGHEVLSLADASAQSAEPPSREPPIAPTVRESAPVPVGPRGPAPARSAITTPGPADSIDPVPARSRPATPSMASARAPADATLLRALAQAAGRAADDGELLRTLPSLASLRGNPAARRALWPRLRALRRGARR